MRRYVAKCRDCHSEMFGQSVAEIGSAMISHHRQARLDGTWTSAACGIFEVTEPNGNKRWLESTMNVIVTPWVGQIWYDPKRNHAKENT